MKIFSAEKIRAWDQFTIKNEPISSLELMERAATQCAKQILGSIAFTKVDIVCGVGNNGGDGLVIARLLHQREYDVRVIKVEFSENYSPDFKANLERLPKGIEILKLTEKEHEYIPEGDLIIDAIFGSGLNKSIRGWIGNITDKINNVDTEVIAVDLPSGLFADDNRENDLEHVVQADLTLTFQCPKMVFFYPAYHQYVGEFKVIDIGLSHDYKAPSSHEYLVKNDIILNKRSKFSHKGSHGYLSIVGGFEMMTGAVILASRAAFRAGCGYVGVWCSEKGAASLLSHNPEVIFSQNVSEKATALAIGPGLGQSSEANQALESTLKLKLPMVIDADAINLIAKSEKAEKLIPENAILTPHLGELQRLLNSESTDELLLEKQLDYSKKNKIYILQKGAFSKLTCPDGRVFINSTGNPGMASAGMGDALTGIIGSLLAQGYSSENAAVFGMFLHGLAGDLHEHENYQEGMITSDLIAMIPKAVHQCSR